MIGLAHEVARPELIGQPVNRWLKDVFYSGKPKINKEFLVKLRHKERLREAIVNSIYQPIFSENGNVTGVLVILEEITEQVLARRKNDNDQQMLALAIDAGELATFYYQPATNLFSGNQLLKKWFGLSADENLDLSVALSVIVAEDRDKVTKAISKALSKDSDGHYFIEYHIQNSTDQNQGLYRLMAEFFMIRKTNRYA
ncbi:hypothetical protein SAMN05421793_14417 [Epilithonimonas hominis]|uniref:PAS domain-containing protein n=1 Tax=Epilithonimonas hominis TaxID=420404 RepID=A0A1H6LSI5_9FLAO|nr:hypothetical protein SAMN05421793_14417 [Epilithonimonas hominis]